ncbi:MAG: ABC transporter substrate-binding protein [Oscillospiraceae bacterium]|nr:ABC transporter substrate-binding protein [Oscillospiraceae bacterium]
MKKRVFALLLVVLLVVGLLAGCGGGNTVTLIPRPAAPAALGAPAQVDEVTIGVLAPLTGSVAQFGVAVQQGVQLYVDQFNAQGGLQVVLDFFDEEGQAPLGVTGYHALMDRGVDAIIGAVTSGVTRAVVPLGFADNMPMITATSTHLNVTVDEDTGQVFHNMFRSCFIDPFQGYVMANFAHNVVGAETVAILYNNENDYSIGLKEAFEAQATALGLEIVAVERFQTDAVDFHGQLTNIAGQNPDALFIPYYYLEVALMGPQSVAVGLDTVLLGADGWATILDFMEDPSSLEGAYFLTGFTPELEDATIQRFVAEFEAEYGVAPNMFAAQAYDAAMILIAAIEATIADGFYPAHELFRASVIGHMYATDLVGVTGRITFDEYNNPQKTAVILNIQDGVERFWGYF